MGKLAIPLEEKNIVEIAEKLNKPHTAIGYKDKRFLVVVEHIYNQSLYPSLPYLGIPTPALSLIALGEPMTKEGKEKLMNASGGRAILFGEDREGMEVFSYTVAYLTDRNELALGFAYTRLKKGEEEGRSIRKFIDGEWLTGRMLSPRENTKERLKQTKDMIKFMSEEEERKIRALLLKLSFWIAKNTANILRDEGIRKKAHKAETTASLLTKQAFGLKPKSKKEQIYLMQRGYEFLGRLKKL